MDAWILVVMIVLRPVWVGYWNLRGDKFSAWLHKGSRILGLDINQIWLFKSMLWVQNHEKKKLRNVEIQRIPEDSSVPRKITSLANGQKL